MYICIGRVYVCVRITVTCYNSLSECGKGQCSAGAGVDKGLAWLSKPELEPGMQGNTTNSKSNLLALSQHCSVQQC